MLLCVKPQTGFWVLTHNVTILLRLWELNQKFSFAWPSTKISRYSTPLSLPKCHCTKFVWSCFSHRPEKIRLRCFAEEVCQPLETYSGNLMLREEFKIYLQTCFHFFAIVKKIECFSLMVRIIHHKHQALFSQLSKLRT